MGFYLVIGAIGFLFGGFYGAAVAIVAVAVIPIIVITLSELFS